MGRKLVLLAYLALSGRPVARDRLATFLWGHRDDERARHSLRDALSVLRQTLGTAIPLRLEMVALAHGAPLEVDVLELRAAARAGDHARVVALYRGPFLDGVHAGDAREVEDWISEERRSAERIFVAACAPECARLAEAGESEACAALARRWLDADPTDEPALVMRLTALAAPDTRAALRQAIMEYERHSSLLEREYEETPQAAAHALSAELATRLAGMAPNPQPANLQTVVAAPYLPSAPTHAISGIPPAAMRPYRRAMLAAGAGMVVLLAIFGMLRGRGGGDSPRTADIVVAGIESPSPTPEDTWLEEGLPRLLTSSLIREHVPGVLDPSLVRSAARSARLGDSNGRTDGAQAMLVARHLHAGTLVSGEITRGGGRYFLDLIIRNVATGRIHNRVSVNDTSLFGLVDRATARLLAAVDRPSTGFRFEDVETSSVEAYRAYIRALDRLDAGHYVEGAQLLDAAISADSTFAAALQLRANMLTRTTSAGTDSFRRIAAALARVRGQESDFDGRVSAISSALQQGNAVREAQLGRDLVSQYSRDARAYLILGNTLLFQGSFSEASRVAMRALALDSGMRTSAKESCPKCALYRMVVAAALAAGDASRAYSAARDAVALQASEPAPWESLSRAALAFGLPDEAISAAERAMRLAPREEATAQEFGWLLLESGRLETADSLINDWQRPGSELASTALDLKGALLRERGQYRAAARTYATMLAHAQSFGDSASVRLMYASSLARAGEVVTAKRVFERAALHVAAGLSRPGVILSPSEAARGFAWPHALLADALFLGGSRDTLGLLVLADSIESIGRRSTFGRDSRLHFHVRGLVAEIGGRWQEAERAFERARWGRGGWTRTNVELARVQVAQGRALEAVSTLRDVRFGTLDGMGRYAPRSEINAALAEAFLSARLPDSARVYLSKVRSAWKSADPPQRRRIANIEQALQAGAVVKNIDRRPPAQQRVAAHQSLRPPVPLLR